jgi:hypothetical protein
MPGVSRISSSERGRLDLFKLTNARDRSSLDGMAPWRTATQTATAGCQPGKSVAL